MKVTVVYDKITMKLIPFFIDERSGEVIITSTDKNLNHDNLIVSNVDPRRLNLFDGYLLKEGEIYSEEKS